MHRAMPTIDIGDNTSESSGSPGSPFSHRGPSANPTGPSADVALTSTEGPAEPYHLPTRADTLPTSADTLPTGHQTPGETFYDAPAAPAAQTQWTTTNTPQNPNPTPAKRGPGRPKGSGPRQREAAAFLAAGPPPPTPSSLIDPALGGTGPPFKRPRGRPPKSSLPSALPSEPPNTLAAALRAAGATPAPGAAPAPMAFMSGAGSGSPNPNGIVKRRRGRPPGPKRQAELILRAAQEQQREQSAREGTVVNSHDDIEQRIWALATAAVGNMTPAPAPASVPTSTPAPAPVPVPTSTPSFQHPEPAPARQSFERPQTLADTLSQSQQASYHTTTAPSYTYGGNQSPYATSNGQYASQQASGSSGTVTAESLSENLDVQKFELKITTRPGTNRLQVSGTLLLGHKHGVTETPFSSLDVNVGEGEGHSVNPRAGNNQLMIRFSGGSGSFV